MWSHHKEASCSARVKLNFRYAMNIWGFLVFFSEVCLITRSEMVQYEEGT